MRLNVSFFFCPLVRFSPKLPPPPHLFVSVPRLSAARRCVTKGRASVRSASARISKCDARRFTMPRKQLVPAPEAERGSSPGA